MNVLRQTALLLAHGSFAVLGSIVTDATANERAIDLIELADERSPASRAIVGRWKDEDHGAIVEVKESKGVFTGRIISTPLEGVKPGTATFRRLKWHDKESAWVGKVYAPRRKSEYDATYKIVGGRLKMRVTFGPLWKNVYWDRVK